MYFSIILVKRLVKMMLLFEIKKVLSKPVNKIALLILASTLAVVSYFAVISVSYTDENGGIELQAVGEPLSFSKYTSADLNHDGLNELLLFNLPGSDTESASAVVYSMENGRVRRLGQTKLDSNVTAYSSVTVDSSDPDNPVVYADAYKNNGSAMITEIVYWSDYYDTIISPFYDYDTGLTRETFRENTVQCRDIDGDGKVEIPMDVSSARLKRYLRQITLRRRTAGTRSFMKKPRFATWSQ